MALKLSIFTTVTSPNSRGDTHEEALLCYSDLADELVVVDGSFQLNNPDKKWFERMGFYINYDEPEEEWIEPRIDKRKISEWPKEFNWSFIGQQFQRGYEACTGDWVIHADLDFIFHEQDFENIRKACEDNPKAPALSFWKYQFILPHTYNLKSRLVIAVNKKRYGDRIRFDSGGDLCQPSLDGQYIKPSDVPEARVPFYNYEKLLKTKKQIMDDVGRMDRAYQRHFGKWLYSTDGTDESAYKGWLEMSVGRYHKPQKEIKLKDHPKYIQETIKNLKPGQWGYDGHGYLKENSYV